MKNMRIPPHLLGEHVDSYVPSEIDPIVSVKLQKIQIRVLQAIHAELHHANERDDQAAAAAAEAQLASLDRVAQIGDALKAAQRMSTFEQADRLEDPKANYAPINTDPREELEKVKRELHERNLDELAAELKTDDR